MVWLLLLVWFLTSAKAQNASSPIASELVPSTSLLSTNLVTTFLSTVSPFSSTLLLTTLASTAPNPAQTFNFRDKVTSGSVVLVDKKTLFIPNFQYNGASQNVRFCLGNGTEPSSDCAPIPDENNSTENLKTYEGQDITLHLPNNLSSNNFDYISVWSFDEGISLGYVSIKGIEAPTPQKKVASSINENERFSMRLPKCCPDNQILTKDGCKLLEPVVPFKPQFKVYEHNETHFSNESLDLALIEFEPYISNLQCSDGKYPLNEPTEEFALLKNTSLLVKGATFSGILSVNNFCLERIQLDTIEMKVLVCAPPKIFKATYFLYIFVFFTAISIVCLVITVVMYLFILQVEDIHRRCFTAYAFMLAVTFLCMFVVQVAGVEGAACQVLGFFFQISMIASFTLLAILCVDIWIIIKYINERQWEKRRSYGYIAAALALPILFLIISLSRNLTPDVPDSFFKPQYMKNMCTFEAENQRKTLFYVPIVLCMTVSAISLGFTKFYILKYDKDPETTFNFYWIEKSVKFKFMWRKHFIIFLTSLLWSVEAVLHLFVADASMMTAFESLEASQGFIVLLLFVLNKETRREIINNRKARKKNRETAFSLENEYEMTKLNNSS